MRDKGNLLPGRVWNQLSESYLAINLSTTAGLPPMLGAPRSLFDLQSLERSIFLSVLFGLETEDELAVYLSQAGECDGLCIVLDNAPVSRGSVLQAFYQLRVRQAIARVVRAVPRAAIRICLPIVGEENRIC